MFIFSGETEWQTFGFGFGFGFGKWMCADPLVVTVCLPGRPAKKCQFLVEPPRCASKAADPRA